MSISAIFISHATEDKAFATQVQKTLQDFNVAAWIDHEKLTAGKELPTEIQAAIRKADFFVLVLSLPAMNSAWVIQECKWALKNKKNIKIIPLLMKGVKPTAAKQFLGGRELKCIKVKKNPQSALVELHAALGLHLPDHDPPIIVVNHPMEELILHLQQATLDEINGTRRVTAQAHLRYLPGTGGPSMKSARYTFQASLGPIANLAWYLERFPRWPGAAFRMRAKQVEERLPKWGKALYKEALNKPEALPVRTAWERANKRHNRRLTIVLDDWSAPNPLSEETDTSNQNKRSAEAALLSLPWELLHSGHGFLCNGLVPVRVRRQLPQSKPLDPLITQPPLRVLLLSPRPEDEKAGYIDHRVTALPVAKTLAGLGDLASLTVLTRPTLAALVEALSQAEKKGTPYHVVHFDGHGVYIQDEGLGALCFEAENQDATLVKRKTHIVNTKELTERLTQIRIPLIFLQAYQSAQAELDSSASVAAALLDQGVAAVAAMSHSVLVVTAKEFVTQFYQELAAGARVGEAMLAGQRRLFNQKHRGEYQGAGALELHDWFVPVLYQEEGDFALVNQLPTAMAQELLAKRQAAHLGVLPEPPPHEFVGRSREMLALERLLLIERYAVLLGEGGEGKTALAVETARWLALIHRVDRVAFVSLEKTTHVDAVVDEIGRQLVGQKQYARATFSNLDQACQPIERVLRSETTLLVLDNLETVLPPRAGGQPGEYEPERLAALLALFQRLQNVGATRLLLTSRERMPAPFDAGRNHLDIGPLAPWDAVEMVKNVLQRAGVTPADKATVNKESMLLDLVQSVHCHARTLALLAPELARQGVTRTTADLHQLMHSLEKQYPGERERSLYAGLALSLNRLSPTTRQTIRPLGVFQGGGDLKVIAQVLKVEEPEQLVPLFNELAQTGLCDLHETGYITFHFALAPFLWGELSAPERQAAQESWLTAEADFAGFLYQQRFQDVQLSATLTQLDLNNLLTGLEQAANQWPVEPALNWASDMAGLLQNLGRQSARQRVATLRERLVAKLGEGWSHLRFTAAKNHIEHLAQQGQLPAALAAAQTLLQQAQAAGEDAYPGAAYDLAMSYALTGRQAQMVGMHSQAVPWLQEARTRLQGLGSDNPNARKMAAGVLNELGDCWLDLSRLEEAATCYEQSGQEQEQEGNQRGVAVSKIQLGTARMRQGRHDEALSAFQEARELFARLNEPETLAGSWHQTGRVYEAMQAWPQAEEAYQQALKINTALGNLSGEAMTLGQLGNLFKAQKRWEEAVAQYRQAGEIYIRLQDGLNKGKTHSNLADTLIKLGRLDEAHAEILQAIECKKPFGHAAEPWTTYHILSNLEMAAGNPQAAAKAHREARERFAQFRRDGGENHNPGAKWCQATAVACAQGQEQQAQAELKQVAQNPQLPSYLQPLIPVLLAILADQREPTLADTAGLDYDDAVEVELLLEKLAQQ